MLLEGPPGLAKTLACRSLAAALHGEFKRIQFTPDLLPSDIVGTRIFDQRESTFATVRGPIFANVVLADEINRAPAKVQSALLEAMQERQVTIGPQTHRAARSVHRDGDDESARFRRHLRPSRRADGPLPAQSRRRLSVARRKSLRSSTASRSPIRSRHRAGRDARRRACVARSARMRCTSTISSNATSSSSSSSRANVAMHRALIDYGASPRATLAIANLARAKAMLEQRDTSCPTTFARSRRSRCGIASGSISASIDRRRSRPRSSSS